MSVYACGVLSGARSDKPWFWSAGSAQEEMGALVQQSINDSKISGSDRPVAWDGETRSGAGLQNQLKQIQESKVSGLRHTAYKH